MRLRSFVVARPTVFVVLVIGMLEAVVLGGLLVARLLGIPLVALDLPFLLVNAAVAAALLSALGWWRAAGFNAPSRWRELHLMLVPVALLLVPLLLVRPSLPAPGMLAVLVVVALLIGFQEEAVFRGVLLRALGRYGAISAVVISAALFGAIHANSFLLGRDPLFVTAQIVASFLGAIGLGALRLRMETIWPLVFLHALNGVVQFGATGGLEAQEVALHVPILKVVVAGALGLYGLYLLGGVGARARLVLGGRAPARAAR